MTHPSVTIVILNWNNAPDTLACLESVSALDHPNYDVVVVDNGSADDSVELLLSRHPSLELLPTGKNLGYAGGNNVGISRALADGADYVCVLNNDTLVAPEFLSALVGQMEAEPRIGIAGPLVYYTNPPDTIFSAGCEIDWRNGLIHHRGMGVVAKPRDLPDFSLTSDVDALAGCGFLVSRAAITRAGLLNQDYFLNLEDIDWCVRIAFSGYRVRFVPEAVLYHKVSATLGQNSPANTYYMTRNSLRFFRQYGPSKPRALVAIIWRTARSVGAWSFKKAYAGAHYKRHRAAAVHAVGDFLLGKYGSA